jgi:hypothetical protein
MIMPKTAITAANGAKFWARHTQQELAVLDAVIRSVPFGLVVELGTGEAGGTYALSRRETPVLSFDIKCPKLTAKQYEALGPGVLFVGCSVLDNPERVFSLWQNRPWPVFVYCDNGNKPQEVKLFAPRLRPGDVIGCHDIGKELKPEDLLLLTVGFTPWLLDVCEETRCRFWLRSAE